MVTWRPGIPVLGFFRTKNKSIPITKLKSSQYRPLGLKHINFDAHTKTKWFLARIQKPRHFWPPTQKSSQSILTLRTRNFRPANKKQINFDPFLKTKQFSADTFSIPPDTKTKLISIQILNKVIFNPPTKPSQFWSLRWNLVNSDPHTEIKSVSTTHTTMK